MSCSHDDVRRYLQEHPDFFLREPALVVSLALPSEGPGGTVSLAQHQASLLRGQLQALEEKFAQLLQIGRQNDQLAEKLHRLALALIGAETRPQVRHILTRALSEEFAVPTVRLGLPGWLAAELPEALAEFARTLAEVHVGSPPHPALAAWLGADVASYAVLPLPVPEEGVGLLALGSPEPQRFYPAMGTVFLRRIGELAAAALARCREAA